MLPESYAENDNELFNLIPSESLNERLGLPTQLDCVGGRVTVGLQNSIGAMTMQKPPRSSPLDIHRRK